MPELPEVETTRNGISPYIHNKVVTGVIVRQTNLRWPVSPDLVTSLLGQKIEEVDRRGKYLLLKTQAGTVIIHLGMSGSLRILQPNNNVGKHDHVDIVFEDQITLRFTDPRRFGCVLWNEGNINKHPLLAKLGPEPMSDDLTPAYLHTKSRLRKSSIKVFIMDSHIVVGVGNIYANEALYEAGIHPKRAAGRISLARYKKLTDSIKKILRQAIDAGGTTLRDFTGSDGQPGYFKQSLRVYGRGGEACDFCETPLTEIRLGQRSTVYCTQCQR
jgi:formamidopyrimidine-DNA glycosylase